MNIGDLAKLEWLQDGELVQQDTALEELARAVGGDWPTLITGAVERISAGGRYELWFTCYSRPYELRSVYELVHTVANPLITGG